MFASTRRQRASTFRQISVRSESGSRPAGGNWGHSRLVYSPSSIRRRRSCSSLPVVAASAALWNRSRIEVHQTPPIRPRRGVGGGGRRPEGLVRSIDDPSDDVAEDHRDVAAIDPIFVLIFV